MVKKYKYFIVISLILILFIILKLNKEKDYLKTNIINLPYEKLNLKKAEQVLNIHHIHNNILGLSIENFGTSDIGITKSILTYDMEKSTYELIDLDFNTRIVDFVMVNDKMYFISLEYQEDYYKWKIIFSKNNFEDQVILKEGIIENPFNYPAFIFDNNNYLYIAYLDDKNHTSTISKIKNVTLNEILVLNQEYSIYDLEKIIIYDNYIYYIILTDNFHYLEKYDYRISKKSPIYIASNIKELIFDFQVLDESILINTLNDEKSTLININFDNEIIKEKNFNYPIVSMKKSNNKIITINKNKKFQIYDANLKRLFTNKFEKDIYYKFELYRDNTLILNTEDKIFTSIINN